MLDAETKRHIDAARQVLVGKVPDPKAQVDQITTALIYKFMDDMDKESQELGGKAQFFSGDFSQYSWTKILDSKLSGQERFNLYNEAIKKMPRNENIPQLFRDIFKDALLPYRDSATLSLFLKEIDNFTYDHSENLGDAFEYLLSILGSQGDAGQFRTPRHIIDFIVDVVDPKKNETILDPACGTAGFLISAYKHIVENNDGKDNKTGELTDKETTLTPDEKQRLVKNVVGYDISPDMVKLSLVNMYLHKFTSPQIFEYDTLTSESRWDDQFDVILANPPFMTPKGGIRPHKRFSVQASRSEVLFVDYILEHLNLKGRAGIIVPEGIIFKADKAYKSLRKKLIDDGLVAVVSLPAGVFKPYSGVKTSVLFFDNQVAKTTDELLFIKIENDGYELGDQRRKIKENDLPEALEVLQQWKQGKKKESELALWVKKEKIAKSEDYSLVGDRYGEVKENKKQKYPMVELGEVCGFQRGTMITKNMTEEGDVPVIASSKRPSYYHNQSNRQPPTITISSSGDAGFVNFFEIPIFASDCFTVEPLDKDQINIYFLYSILKSKQECIYKLQKGVAQKHVYPKDISTIKIPLPPLKIQQQIVEEIEVKQNAINHAQEIIKNLERERLYFGNEIRKLKNVKWVELGEVVQTIVPPKKIKKRDFAQVGDYPIIDQSQSQIAGWSSDESAVVKIQNPVVIFGDHTCAIKYADRPFIQGADGCKILEVCSNLMPKFLFFYLKNHPIQKEGYKRNFTRLRLLKVPLLSHEIQKQLVAEAEKEEAIIKANQTLIKIMEDKIDKVLREVGK
ncbi:MAG: N-6 DNA methylase [Candidatus Spechtbacteria bacterium SB0662_bin_43]|uniref:site-specific DNA-methyltransferase (adenine-specific) n=1 Tax=Candidatus Spechtbacteria bacterium SB0662_bin_43 TaxID=2604897 RepID=A0A845DBQ7_9BACT|nr:N-6 DNA methylase [Candidatus Spechtbacteria bacterium SB0662_bin_43]